MNRHKQPQHDHPKKDSNRKSVVMCCDLDNEVRFTMLDINEREKDHRDVITGLNKPCWDNGNGGEY